MRKSKSRGAIHRARIGVRHLKGDFLARGKTFGLVVSRFNEYLTSQLLQGALDTLERHGARGRDITVVHTPGAFEIPLAAKKLIQKKRPDAVITLAVVIRGQTRHFDQVVTQSARGVREISMKTDTPVILGILPAMNARQAMERVGIKQMNKGREWALAAIEMASLMRRLDSKKKMRKRTQSREYALQILYQMDIRRHADPNEVMDAFWQTLDSNDSGGEVKMYAQRLVQGTLEKMEKIDALIERFAENWDIRRMAYVDRNILRLSTFEMVFSGEVPMKVAINEAVELAKRFGEPDSSKFVNGILDKIAKNECRDLPNAS